MCSFEKVTFKFLFNFVQMERNMYYGDGGIRENLERHNVASKDPLMTPPSTSSLKLDQNYCVFNSLKLYALSAPRD